MIPSSNSENYFLNRSIMTARRITTPTITCCTYVSTLLRWPPFRTTPINNEPISVPITVPRPPKRLVPPTTTAAITSSSYINPEFGWAEFPLDASRIPLSDARTPEMMYTCIRMRLVSIPASLAASTFPPTAYTYRPNRVCVRTKWAAPNTTSMMMVGMGISAIRPRASTANPSGSSQMGRPSVTTNAAPRQIVIRASVTMNGVMRNFVTKMPAAPPVNTPNINPAPMPSGYAIMGEKSSFNTTVVTTPANATTEPTERSIPAVRMTNVIPTAMIAVMEV